MLKSMKMISFIRFALVLFLCVPAEGGKRGGGKRGGGKKGGKRVRALELADVIDENSIFLTPDGAYYRKIADSCSDYEYEGAIHVSTHPSHIYAIAIPKKDATVAGCPVLATHANFDTDGAVAEKEMMVFASKDVGDRVFGKGGTLAMGDFMLSELLRAYEEADPSVAGVYDDWTNNCFNYVVDLAKSLGVKVDTRVISFVARRLLESNAEELMRGVRAHFDFYSFIEGRNLRADYIPDEELSEKVVQDQAAPLL